MDGNIGVGSSVGYLLYLRVGVDAIMLWNVSRINFQFIHAHNGRSVNDPGVI